MDSLTVIRQQLARVLDWEDAHAGYDAAVRHFPPDLRGVRPAGLAHSAWELIEHLRITQRDILDFCQATAYQALRWPQDYWPASPHPPAPKAWDTSVAAFQTDRRALKQMAVNPGLDLMAVVLHGTDQTYLRELLLVADHNAYHVGQLILVRRALGAWPAPEEPS
jgi:hypothetical protein